MILVVAAVEAARIALRTLTGRGDIIRATPMRRTEYNMNDAEASPSPVTTVIEKTSAELASPSAVPEPSK